MSHSLRFKVSYQRGDDTGLNNQCSKFNITEKSSIKKLCCSLIFKFKLFRDSSLFSVSCKFVWLLQKNGVASLAESEIRTDMKFSVMVEDDHQRKKGENVEYNDILSHNEDLINGTLPIKT